LSIVFKNITSRLTPQCNESVNVGLSAGHTLTDHFAFRRLIVCRKACKGLVRQGLCTASNRILIRTKLILNSLQPCFQRSASRVRVLLLAGRRFYHRHFQSQPRASNSFFRSMVFVPYPAVANDWATWSDWKYGHPHEIITHLPTWAEKPEKALTASAKTQIALRQFLSTCYNSCWFFLQRQPNTCRLVYTARNTLRQPGKDFRAR